MSAILKPVLLAVLLSLAPEAQQEARYHIYFPALDLARQDGERIESVEVALSGGRFCGVGNIPKDWSVQVVSPSSGRTSLRASAGHGSTALWNMDEFQGSIAVCLSAPISADGGADVSAVVVSATQDARHKHEFKSPQLVLKP